MSWIWHALVSAYAVLAIVPVIPFLAVFVIMAIRGANRKKAIRLAMDITTVFLIGIVASLLKTRTGSNLGIYFIVLLMLIGAGLIGNVQNRIRGKINAPKIFRAVWRLSFFAMGVMYILLMSLELIAPSQK
jgi:hypothetical protein